MGEIKGDEDICGKGVRGGDNDEGLCNWFGAVFGDGKVNCEKRCSESESCEGKLSTVDGMSANESKRLSCFNDDGVSAKDDNEEEKRTELTVLFERNDCFGKREDDATVFWCKYGNVSVTGESGRDCMRIYEEEREEKFGWPFISDGITASPGKNPVS